MMKPYPQRPVHPKSALKKTKNASFKSAPKKKIVFRVPEGLIKKFDSEEAPAESFDSSPPSDYTTPSWIKSAFESSFISRTLPRSSRASLTPVNPPPVAPALEKSRNSRKRRQDEEEDSAIEGKRHKGDQASSYAEKEVILEFEQFACATFDPVVQLAVAGAFPNTECVVNILQNAYL